MRKLLILILVAAAVLLSVCIGAQAEALTPTEIMIRYPAFVIEDDVLQPLNMQKKTVGSLYVDKCAMAPALYRRECPFPDADHQCGFR